MTYNPHYTTGGDEMKKASETTGHGTNRNHIFSWLPRVMAVLLLAIQLAACSKQTNTTKQPAKPPEPKNQTYRMIGGHSVISLVSSDELEIRQGGENLVCKYTKQDGRLRVVVNALGTTTAKYFNITPEGLVDEDGDTYYEPATYEKITAQIELNRQLWAAVERDDSVAVGDLIGKGAAVETRDGRRTALVMAIEEGKVNAVAALLKHGADGNAARTLAASLGGGWIGERRRPEHDAIAAILLKSTTTLPAPLLERIEAPFTIMAIEISGSRDFGLKLRTVGDRPVGKATISIGDYTFEKDDVTPNPKHYIIGYGYCLADSDNPYNVQARLKLDDADIGSSSNIPVVISLNSAGGKKDEVYFTIPALGGERVYLRSPWNSLESTESSVGQLLDEIPTDVANRKAEREALWLQYSKTVLGVWKDQDGDLYEYKADGTKTERLQNGRESSEQWAIRAGYLECTSWRGKILTLNDSQYAIALPNGGTWSATRVSQQVLDDAREAVNKVRRKFIGRWRDEQGDEFSINADGTMTGAGRDGNWSTDGKTFTSPSGKEWDIVSVTDSAFELKWVIYTWNSTTVR